MRQSELFTKTQKTAPKDETSLNAQLLIRAGFVAKEMAGVYAFLPLGLRVINKIGDIIREEMNEAGGQEVEMTALQRKDIWEKSGRWDDKVVDCWLKTKLSSGSDLGLAFTHEEPLTEIMTKYVSSYKDLPIYPYQIQTKFRNELRAKAGLMRGREFLMKDMYSFSKNKEEHAEFYEKMKRVYMNIYNRLGMGDITYVTISSGGSFSKYSYEFQTVSDAGEDIIYIVDEKNKIAINKDDFNDELLKDFDLENISKDKLKTKKTIEVGDIYSLGEKYSKAAGLTYKNKDGENINVYMGCYGIGVSRLMGAIVELFSDEKGLVWPKNVAPFAVHLISLSKNKEAKRLYNKLQEKGVEVLFDDREDVGAGVKFADSDLIGIPLRVIVSEKTIAEGKVEIKKRNEDEAKMITEEELLTSFTPAK